MNILVLGGTGAIGSHLVKILNETSNNVVVTSRKDRSGNDTIQYVKGDAKNLSFLTSLLEKKWDIIVDFMNYKTIEFAERIDLILNSAKQYFFLSSARVYDNFKPINEKSSRLLNSSHDSIFLSSDEYALAKARQENILFSSPNKNWVIIRPYITYSEKRLQLGNLEKEEWLYRALKRRTIVFSSDMMKKMTTMTYGQDVARSIYKLFGNTKIQGNTIQISNVMTCNWQEILDIYLDVFEECMGFRPNVLLQNTPDYLKWNRNKYQIIYDRMFDRTFDNAKLKQYIDVDTFKNWKCGLKECLSNFLLNPEFYRIDWKKEAIKDAYANEKTKLKEISGYKNKFEYLKYRYFRSADR